MTPHATYGGRDLLALPRNTRRRVAPTSSSGDGWIALALALVFACSDALVTSLF